jgi:hypothetical protein
MQSKDLKTVEVLSASDLNIKYLNCVESYISAWLSVPVQNQIKFIPKVLIVAKSIPKSLLHFSEFLVLIDPLDMPTAFVSQTARIIEAQNSVADYVMTSDIDMLPLSVSFECALIDSHDFDPNSFFILRDVLEPGQYPICYNLAKPEVWRSLIHSYGVGSPTSKILRDILDEFGGNSAYSGLHGGSGWTIDQQTLWNLIQDNVAGIRFEKFLDSQTRHRRLDRIHHRGFLKWLILPLVFIGFYHDYHVHHPIVANMKYVKVALRIRNLGIGLRQS